MEKRPVVVLLHGFMQKGTDMDGIAQALEPRYRVIAPTLAAADPEHATLDALALSVRDAIVSAAPDTEKAALLGYSMGGRIALAYARLFPETLSALILESAGLGPENEVQREEFACNSERLANRIEGCSNIAEFVDYWETLPLFAGQREANPEAFAVQRESRLDHRLEEISLLTRYAGAHTMPQADETRSYLEELASGEDAVPVLYLAGRFDSKYAAYAASLEGGNVQTELFDCGHNVHLELPEEYAECVARFLERAQGGRA